MRNAGKISSFSSREKMLQNAKIQNMRDLNRWSKKSLITFRFYCYFCSQVLTMEFL